MPAGSGHSGRAARVLSADSSKAAAESIRKGQVPVEILTAEGGAAGGGERVMGASLVPTGETLSLMPECILGRPINDECTICMVGRCKLETNLSLKATRFQNLILKSIDSAFKLNLVSELAPLQHGALLPGEPRHVVGAEVVQARPTGA